MKKILVLLLLAAAVAPASAQKHRKSSSATRQEAKAPDAVQQAFQQRFAGATEVAWHKMASGHWYADFHQDSLATKVEYDPDGQWVATRAAIPPAQLPDTVTRALGTRYPGAVVQEATRIERADVAPYFRLEVDLSGTTKELLANEQGTLIE